MIATVKTGKDLIYMEVRLKQVGSVVQAKRWSKGFRKTAGQPRRLQMPAEAIVLER